MSSSIGIEISGEFLDLATSTTITLELISPLFSDDVGLGTSSHSFSFTIPGSPKNRRLLMNRDLVLTTKETPVIPVVLYLFGNPWKGGNLIIKQAGLQTGFQVRLEMDASVVARLLESQSLREYTYDGPRIIDTQTGQARAEAMRDHAVATQDGLSDYVFFVYENLQPGDSVPGARGIEGNSWAGNTYTTNYDAGQSPAWNNEFYLTPFVFFKYMLNHVFDSKGLKLDTGSPFFQDPELASLVVFNPVAIDELIGQAFVGAGWRSMNHWAGTMHLDRHLPDVSAKVMLSGTMKLFCAYLDRTKDGYGIYFRKDVISSTDSEDWTGKTVLGGLIDYSDVYEGFSLFSEQDDTDGETSSQKVQPPGFDVDGTAQDFTTLPAPANTYSNQIFYAEFEDSFFQCLLIEAAGNETYEWVFYSRNLFPVVVGDGGISVISEVSTVHMPNPGPPKVQIFPNVIRVDMPLISYARATEDDGEFSPRLMFYRGVEISGPQGGVTSLGGEYAHSLMWHGDDGLYETWWKQWVAFLLQSKISTVPVRLTPADILGMKWGVRKQFTTGGGVASGFVRKIRVQIGVEGIRSSTAEIITG